MLSKTFYSLRNFAVQKAQYKQQYREKNQKAFDLLYDKLTRKYFGAYKRAIIEMRNKNKHSKLFSVFVAWKFYIRENKLVQKYLSECNFQQSNNGTNSKLQASSKYN